MLLLQNKFKGFTIAEVLAATAIVSISIVVLLQTISMVNYQDAQVNKRMAVARVMAQDMDLFARQPSLNSSTYVSPIQVTRTVTAVTNSSLVQYNLSYTYNDVSGQPVIRHSVVYKH